jgi:hypothetical protein
MDSFAEVAPYKFYLTASGVALGITIVVVSLDSGLLNSSFANSYLDLIQYFANHCSVVSMWCGSPNYALCRLASRVVFKGSYSLLSSSCRFLSRFLRSSGTLNPSSEGVSSSSADVVIEILPLDSNTINVIKSNTIPSISVPEDMSTSPELVSRVVSNVLSLIS